MCDIAVLGLAVMGRNLALNLEEQGYAVAVYNRTAAAAEEFIAENPGKRLQAAHSLAELCALLKPPRKILLMVKAGAPVDDVIEQLLPALAPGDILMDGGNSHFQDTMRRVEWCARAGIHFAGVGISGGEEGARRGAAIMPGCTEEVWRQISPLLTKAAAVAEGEPCCVRIGSDGAGHFVKTVHNGIEYADMQLISECYALLRRLGGFSVEELQGLFAQWNRGELSSYLVEITADILGQRDEQTGRPMVDVIRGRAGSKGTGKWTSQQSLDLGMPAPTIAEAVFARYLSAHEEVRLAAQGLEGGAVPPGPVDKQALAEDVRRALYCGKVCAYAQGFALMREAGQVYGWQLDFGAIASIFRGGCIIRAEFLNRIRDAYRRRPDLANLLLDGFFAQSVGRYLPAWRRVAARAVEGGVACPGLLSALSYYDGIRDPVGAAGLIQAQRDYFGAHTFERVDQPGHFHRQWQK